jgi:3'(2'), 5'-bisphosphate nucleotidase
MTENIMIAANAAIEAGKVIMNVYESDFNVAYKTDDSPLTIADKQANDVINNYLDPTGIPIISEENKIIDPEVRKGWNQVWIVDPLDGTKEFVKRNGEFTVNIALIEQSNPVFGVIYVPVTKTLYLGNVTEGWSKKIKLHAHRPIDKADLTEKSNILPRPASSSTIRIVGSRSHMNSNTQNYIDTQLSKGKQVEIVSRGSSLKFCLVAEGAADVYPRYAPTMEWDTAAGQAICEAVGVKVLSLENEKPMQYNKENLLNPYFIVDALS